MPHVLDDPDILEYPSASSAYDELPGLPLGLPTSVRGRTRFLTFLRRLIAPAPRLRACPQEHCTPGAPRVETFLNILAREYPDSHLQVMAIIG